MISFVEFANIVIEAPVLSTKHVEILEGVVGGKIFELNEKVREDFFHSFHEFLHELVHLSSIDRPWSEERNCGNTNALPRSHWDVGDELRYKVGR